MNRGELYQSVLRLIADKLVALKVLNSDDADDELAKVDFESDDVDSRNWFDDRDCGIYQCFIDSIKRLDAASNVEVPLYTHLRLAEVPDNCIQNWIPLAIHDESSQLVVVTSTAISELINGSEKDILPILSLIWYKSLNPQGSPSMEDFWNICDNQYPDRYYVLSNQEIPEDQLWNAYSYAILYNINNSTLPKPEELKFEPTTKFSEKISFNLNSEYYQYFEIYRVLLESKYCDNVLSRFLNIYQVIEDLCYRRLLVEISKSRNPRSGFLRNTIRVVNKISNREENEIKDGIDLLFPDLCHQIKKADIDSYNIFLKDNYSISSGESHNNKKIARIIYCLRNSIVHNKHTELHFSFGNVDEYKTVIELLRLLIRKLEKAVIDLLNETSPTKIDYALHDFNLY
jgi:hypothetical protein